MALFGIDIKDLTGAVGAIGGVAKDLRAAITGKEIMDPVAMAQIEAQVTALEQQSAQAQAKIDEVEAASPSIFVSGWRPFIGWICGIALFYNFLVCPLFLSFKVAIVPLDIATLMPLVVGMLGVTAARTAEKFGGVARS
jgi:Holin of 3TMs, for gene-transfer release